MSHDFAFATEYVQEKPWPIAKHVFIIGEVGINHNGDINIAKKLILMAKNAGFDAVKFQKRTIDIVYTKELLDAPRESPWGTTQREQKEGLEFGKAEYDEIDRYCKELGIHWFASAWDLPSQEFLAQYDCTYNKIASAMIYHKDLLEMVAKEGKPTFISTGMTSHDDVADAVDIFRKHNCPIVLMHCIAEYPAPEEILNLRCIQELRERFGVPVGYSGHEVGVMPSVQAAVMGACCIERHITLDRAMYGSDQSASLEKRGMEYLVTYTRSIPVTLGTGVRTLTPKEEECARKLRYYMEM
ncbi:MAG: N-acetylneuraminate synthase family protein [Desulfovibrionaceae bacterium]